LPDTYAWADVVQTLTANGYYSGLLAYDPIYHSGGEEFRLPGPNPGFHFKLRYPTHGACNPKREKLTVEDIHLDPHNPVGNGIENTVEHILFDFLNLDKTPMGSEWVTP
jgi:hypothetical protein